MLYQLSYTPKAAGEVRQARPPVKLVPAYVQNRAEMCNVTHSVVTSPRLVTVKALHYVEFSNLAPFLRK